MLRMFVNVTPYGRGARVALYAARGMSGGGASHAGQAVQFVLYLTLAGVLLYQAVSEALLRPAAERGRRSATARGTVVEAQPSDEVAGHWDVTVAFRDAAGAEHRCTSRNLPAPAGASAAPAVGSEWPDPVRYDPEDPEDDATVWPLRILWPDVGWLTALGTTIVVVQVVAPAALAWHRRRRQRAAAGRAAAAAGAAISAAAAAEMATAQADAWAAVAESEPPPDAHDDGDASMMLDANAAASAPPSAQTA